MELTTSHNRISGPRRSTSAVCALFGQVARSAVSKRVSFEQGQLLLRRDVTEQDAEQGEHRVPEGGLVAVPRDRSPHLEPLAADGQEAAHEKDDDHQQANGGHSPSMVERRVLRAASHR